MKLGLIIIFNNNETSLNSTFFNELLHIANNFELCLVNNGSNDATLEKLLDLKDLFESQITVVDIKKKQALEAANKAGARYLLNKGSLKHIGYINVNDLSNIQHLNKILAAFNKSKQQVIMHNLSVLKSNQNTRVTVKNIFSILKYFSVLKLKVKDYSLNQLVN